MVLDYRASRSGSHVVSRMEGEERPVVEVLIACVPPCVSPASIASILRWVLSGTLARWGKWAFFLLPGMAVRIPEMICCDKWQWLQFMWEDCSPHMGNYLCSLIVISRGGRSWLEQWEDEILWMKIIFYVSCKKVCCINHRPSSHEKDI